MEARRSNLAIKLLPSMTDFAFLMPLLYLFFRMDGTKTLLGDCDAGWHMRTGEWILANHSVPTRDLFSFSRPGEPWYAWEWLADVIWAWLAAHGGLAALVLFCALLLAITYTLVFRLASAKANPVTALGLTMIAAAAASIHWLARPHLFTLLFTVLFYIALERVREGKERFLGVPYLALLPAGTILWTNLHGGFVAGIAMAGAYGVGELLRMAFATGSEERTAAWHSARRFLLACAACLAASLVNPYGYQLHVHVFRYLRDPYQSQHIEEFFSLSFHHPIAIFFEFLLFAGVAASFRFLSRRQFIEPVLILLWGHVALMAARNIPLFGIVAAPAIATALHEWLSWLPKSNAAAWLRRAVARFNAFTAELSDTESIGRWHPVSLFAALAIAAVLYAPNPPANFRAEFDPHKFPVKAVEALQRDPSARIFAHDQWGDYLIYRLYPRTRVLIDGRSDFYGGDFELKVLSVEGVKYDWEKTLNGLGIDTVLLPPTAPLSGALKESRRWRLVYDDGIALVFRPAERAERLGFSSVATSGTGCTGGSGRDREITKIEASDRGITQIKKTT